MALGFVRPARAEDAAEIARIQLLTWRTAYTRLIPPHILDRLDKSWLTDRWLAAVTSPPTPGHHVLVAVEQSEPGARAVGFAAIGPADDDTAAPADPHRQERPAGPLAAVTDLLVEPRFGRRGHGSRLLSAAMAHWSDDGFASAWAWSFAEDPATIAFLQSAGWEFDGATRGLDMDGVVVVQRRLHVSVPERAEEVRLRSTRDHFG